MACITIDSPVGPLRLSAQDGKIRSIEFGRGSEACSGPNEASEEVLKQAASEIRRYFAKELTTFTVPVDLVGPAFHKKVWEVLLSIPFGQTMTYAEIGGRLGSPKAARAVGNACARNPVVIVVPCHRVLSSTGLGGFGGGLDAKRWLLQHEGANRPIR